MAFISDKKNTELRDDGDYSHYFITCLKENAQTANLGDVIAALTMLMPATDPHAEREAFHNDRISAILKKIDKSNANARHAEMLSRAQVLEELHTELAEYQKGDEHLPFSAENIPQLPILLDSAKEVLELAQANVGSGKGRITPTEQLQIHAALEALAYFKEITVDQQDFTTRTERLAEANDFPMEEIKVSDAEATKRADPEVRKALQQLAGAHDGEEAQPSVNEPTVKPAKRKRGEGK
jgi:hypothetical protein